MSNNKRMLEVQDLHGWYGESHVLHGVNFHVDEGEVVTLLGRNGAGPPARCAPSWVSSAAARGR